MMDILNGMCERCLAKGLISTMVDAKTLYDTFDLFCNRKYTNDDEYSQCILYFYNLAVMLHESGNTTLEESYSIYSAILAADRIGFVEIENDNVVTVEPVKIKRTKRAKKDDGVVDITDIVVS